MNHRSLSALLVSVLLVVGSVGVGLAVTAPASPALAEHNETGNETGNATMSNETGNVSTVTILNHTSNGTYVVINRTFVPEGGFVGIHATVPVNETMQNVTDPANLTFGPVIGATGYLEPGVHHDVVAFLEQPINESQYLIAMPHRDANANQVYDFPGPDGPYVANATPVTDIALVEVSPDATLNVTAVNVTKPAMGNETGNATMGNATGNESSNESGGDDGGGVDY